MESAGVAVPAAAPAGEAAMTLRERLAQPQPLRFGEFARLIGYSPVTVRKWIAAGIVRTVAPPYGGSHRRIPASEAVRLCMDLGIS